MSKENYETVVEWCKELIKEFESCAEKGFLNSFNGWKNKKQKVYGQVIFR